ncbi:spermidine synthase (plasmid) [Borrelia turcica IST7]|uniref:Spermidine synthase n=1 Tax=Borrelia turcica IST7 TaxID=1104446 RepID=A0A386PRV2_9SPIR|nr:S-adenosylmethionine decarboxylase [Borrelia turcica]AYE37120.1 spermidine synthase [Borrelia turcica IST7]
MNCKMNNISFWIGCTDAKFLVFFFEKLLIKSKFKILNKREHKFVPYGLTVLFLLAESHLAIHTFPEKNKTYIELTSCVDEQFFRFLKLLDIKELI